MIAQLIEGEQASWDNLLPEITLAVNSSISDTTNFSPIFLMQGREPRMPKELYEEKLRGNGNTPEDFTIKATKMKEIFEVVKMNAERTTADQMRHYNLRRREWRPALGSLVLVKQHQLSRGVDGFAAKLAPKYDGPFRVLKFISPNIVRIQRPGERKRKMANIAELREFRDDEAGEGEEVT